MDGLLIARIPGFLATQAAHAALSSVLRPGDWAVDATAGNGHDTLFLATAVQPGGRVFVCDIQRAALAATRARLAAAGLAAGVDFFQGNHADLPKHLPTNAKGRIRAVIFNLGYLPGGKKSITTNGSSTVRALSALSEYLEAGGLLVVVAYRGHPGGEAECTSVRTWFGRQAEAIRPTLAATAADTHRPAPVLFVGERILPAG